MADFTKKPTKAKFNRTNNNTNKADLSGYVFDKLQPQARDLEEVVLGGMMLDKEAVAEVIDILKPESFYVEAHQHIFSAIHDLFGKSEPVDILTVVEELRKLGRLDEVGGAFYVTQLTSRVGSTANIEFHARIISEKYILRELIRTSNVIIKEAYEETTDVFELLDKAEQNLFTITEQNLRRSYDSMPNLVSQAIQHLESIKNNQEGVVGIPSGFTTLDRLTSGWQKSDLVIMAARPGMGKTAFVLSVARNAAVDFKKPIAIFSLEMSSLQLVNRLISGETGIAGDKLKRGDLQRHEWVELTTKVEKLSEAPLFIDDTPAINIFELRAKCRRLKMQHDIQMIIIDYLQLMSGSSDQKSGNREQEISTISRSLKSIAKELEVPVIALSQLSRAVETRGGDKRPQLSDLRECITGDTLIYLPDTGEYKPVAELEGKNGFHVLAMDKNYKLQAAKCLDVWKTGKKEIYEIETQSGYKIRASLNHPFFTIGGWQQLVDLKVGDKVATARKVTTNSTSSLKDEEIIILAHMLGDGCYVARQPIHYTSQDVASLAIVENIAKNLWDIKTRRKKDKPSNNCYHIYMPSPYHLTHGVHHPFINLLTKCGGEKARSNKKVIPNEIFKCDNRQVALFIQHLWATNGGVFIRKGKGSHKIHYSSNSFELAKGLQSLLLRFEIQCAIRKTQKENYLPNYQLSITGKDNCLKFAYQIGIFGAKSAIINQLIEIFEAKKANPNSDVIPKNIWGSIRTMKKEKGFTERTFQAALETQYCGSGLYKSNISRNRLQRVANILESEGLENMATSDIKWDKIKSITHIGNEETYDIHVEEHHNFVANNFVIHNSGAIEQDADMVIFLYRPEYYGFDQDEEGNSSKGVAEIIIAKHRNGALDTVKVRFVAENAKFENLDTFGGGDFDDLTPLSDIITLGSKMNGNVDTSQFGDIDEDDVPF
ncbi:MAG: replicative DNA helicase [Chitinophagales bacterium]